MRVRTIIAAAMFSFALALVGCSDPQPKEPDGPTATPTQVAPTLPEAATEDSEEGAVAFVKHYIALLNYASDTGDVERLREASDPKCVGCNSYIELYESTYANGGYFKAPGWMATDLEAATSGETHEIWLDIDARAGVYRVDAMTPEKRAVRDTYKLFLSVKRDSSGWLIAEFARQDPSQ